MKKLNLGRELSKNDQKKILGGATLLCWHPNEQENHAHNWPGSCSDWSMLIAYCRDVHSNEASIPVNCF